MAFSPEQTALSERDFARLKKMAEARLADLVPDRPGPAKAARHSLLSPAKRLRAIMTMLTARQCGGEETHALDSACAVEMVHTSSLIFDDLPAMDDATLRRGVPATHVAFGEDVALLAGIGLMNGAFGVVARDEHLSDRQKVRITDTLSAAIGWAGLVNGQALDLEQSIGQTMSAPARKASTLDEMHHCKTGALFVAAVLAGAECAGADEATADMLCHYARSIGLAYQAFDDVLDQVVEDGEAGKSTSRDDGKLTRVSLMGLGQARGMAEQHIEDAIVAAKRCGGDDAPLADLAAYISHKFDEKFTRTAAE